MDGSVAAPDVKDQLSTLLERVGHGEHITITQDGKPVAKLVPAETARAPATDAEREEMKQVVDRLLELRKGTTTGGIGWKALRDDGRKY